MPCLRDGPALGHDAGDVQVVRRICADVLQGCAGMSCEADPEKMKKSSPLGEKCRFRLFFDFLGTFRFDRSFNLAIGRCSFRFGQSHELRPTYRPMSDAMAQGVDITHRYGDLYEVGRFIHSMPIKLPSKRDTGHAHGVACECPLCLRRLKQAMLWATSWFLPCRMCIMHRHATHQ